MALSDLKPDQSVAHEFIVDKIVDKEKTFNSAEGQKMKFVIYFTNTYAAEYCPLVSEGFDKNIQVGKKLLFRIIYRKEPLGDEIKPYTTPGDLGSNLPSSKFSGAVINVGGHPANVALNMATQIYAAKMKSIGSAIVETLSNKQSVSEIIQSIEEHYGITNILEDADYLMNWLVDKVKNPE